MKIFSIIYLVVTTLFCIAPIIKPPGNEKNSVLVILAILTSGNLAVLYYVVFS